MVSIERKECLSISLETARLRIVSVHDETHLDAMIALYGDKEVNQHVASGATLTEDETRQKIARWIARFKEGSPFSGYAVILKETAQCIGQIILKPVRKNKAEARDVFCEGIAEIGYLSFPQYWGKGYASEFSAAVVNKLVPALIAGNYMVKGHPITELIATTKVDNIASNTVLKKVMDHTGTKDRYNSPREWYIKKYT